MKPRIQKLAATKVFLYATLAFCAVTALLLLFITVTHTENNYDSFSEPVLPISHTWTLTDSAGSARKVDLPLTIDYGSDGRYTLSGILPEASGMVPAPCLLVYSNYTDMRVTLDGETIYAYPTAAAVFSGATGNTYHFLRLPVDYAGKTLRVLIRCQLGDDITYLLKAPLLGSKATMLRACVMESLPSILLAGCMLVLALALSALHLAFRRRLELNSATAYTALFALLFGIYVFFETSFAQVMLPNGYALCCATLLLLALLPIPLMGLFSKEVSARFRTVPFWLMVLCSVNLIAQTILNCTGILSVRVMLPATHLVIVLSITVMGFCLFFSDRAEKPGARRTLLSALPMIAGGTVDIALLTVERPSFNNSLWFMLGVTVFILFQFCGFVRGFFVLYRSSLETVLLRSKVYQDMLSGIGNRSAYEQRLKTLSAGAVPEHLCCMVLDINDLKQINDRFGHQMGDDAIAETGRLLAELMPAGAESFRTGGDEFVVLLEGLDEAALRELADRLVREADRRGQRCAIPLSLAVGFGCYAHSDGGLLDFIRRVDTLMYESKRAHKADPGYFFSQS